jgi:hypothetical protein
MLAAVALLFAGVMAAAKLHVSDTPGGLLFYLAFRWGLGELLVCWLAADHIYSTVQQSLDNGRLREWRSTTMAPGDIGQGIARGTASLLMPVVTVLGAIDAAVPVRIAPWAGALTSIALLAVHAATVPLACRFIAGRALRYGGHPREWALGMARLGLLLLCYTLIPAALGVIAAGFSGNDVRKIAAALLAAAALACSFKARAASLAETRLLDIPESESVGAEG